MKIILIGYMASGKSTIGKKLAKTLSLKFIDLDHYIQENEKLTVSKIFEQKGEIYFRKIETKYLQEIINNDNFVLSLGGGTPCYANNIEIINTSNTTSFYLKLPIKTLSDRLIKEKYQRPLVADLEDDKIFDFVAKHLFERQYYYNQAKYIINAHKNTIEEILEKIKTTLNKH